MSVSCGREACTTEGTLRCASCKSVYYCSKTCQKQAWTDHKMQCKMIRNQTDFTSLIAPPKLHFPDSKMKERVNKLPCPEGTAEIDLEYQKMYPDDVVGYKLLKTEIQGIKLNYYNRIRNPEWLDALFDSFKTKRSMLGDRWRDVRENFMDWMFRNPNLKPGDCRVSTSAGIFDDRVVNLCYFKNIYHVTHNSFRTTPAITSNVEVGKTYVSIAFLDLQQLMWSSLVNHTEVEAAVAWYGYDSNKINIARAKLIIDLVSSDISSREILQIWYSTCIGKPSQLAMQISCKKLSLDEKDDDIKQILSFWASTGLRPEETAAHWLKHKAFNGDNYNGMMNLNLENDRVEYLRYLLTGKIFLEPENKKCFGNVTMFCAPKGYEYILRMDDNIFFTIDLKNHNMTYKNSLISSIECKFISKMDRFRENIKDGKLNVQVRHAIVYPTNSVALQEIKGLKAAEICWNQLPDHLIFKDFFEMAQTVSTEGTKHHFELRQWAKFVYGVSLLDYTPITESDFECDEHFECAGKRAKEVYAEAEKRYETLVKRDVGPELRSLNINSTSGFVMRTAEVVLTKRYFKNFMEFFFNNQRVVSKEYHIATYTPFAADWSLGYGSFTLDLACER